MTVILFLELCEIPLFRCINWKEANLFKNKILGVVTAPSYPLFGEVYGSLNCDRKLINLRTMISYFYF